MDKNYLPIRMFLGLAALCLLLPAHAHADDTSVPLAHGKIIRDYARITFEWPQTVYFDVKAKGTQLTISFDHKADPNFGALLADLAPYVVSGERKKDGKTIVLTLDKPYRVRTFVSDRINGIDLLGVDTKLAHNSAKSLAALAPSAGEETPDANHPAPLPSNASDAAVLAGTADGTVPSDGRVKMGISPSIDSAVIRLPFTDRVALAVFTRAHALWIVCNKPLPMDVSDFDTLPQTVIGKGQLLPSRKATVIRMPVDDGVYVHVTKEDNSFAWAILLTSKKQPLVTPLAIDINTDPPAPAHVFIPTLQMADPVMLKDPQVGDQLVVTPLFNPGEGMPSKREFIEFSLLDTAQGIAITKKADEVAVVQLRNGIRVSMPQGATLTPGLPEYKDVSANVGQSLMTLFPYEQWRFHDTSPIEMRKELQGLFHKIIESDNPQEANEARLTMAKRYLSDGMAVEALGLLEGINRTNPSFYRSAKVSALHGAANFLLYRFVEAARDFSAAELNNNKEINYWRAMLSDLLGNVEQSYDYLGMNQDYISKYPPIFRQRLAIVAADRAIDAKEYNTALKIFDKLHQDNIIEPINAYVNFLLAKVSADTSQPQEAADMLDKLAADSSHPFVQARAEFSRIASGMERDTITKEQAIDRLERLRLGWHGDALELQVLTLLGDLYADRKDYINAMRIWNGGVMSYPNTGTAVNMSRRMQEAFITMFNEGVADQLPPLEALALYYEYRNYTPLGSTGNEMIERLADRLVAVDLLEQAAALLDRQMHFQTEKEQRSRTGVKLAHVYLLNHQPQKALAALEDSLYGENPLMLRLLRNRLTAQAMIELGQSDKAMQTLGSDNSADAEHLRISVYWKEHDWPKLIASVEAMFKTRPNTAAPITLEESEYLIKLSLAYVFQNNSIQLQYMHDYFGPLMAGNPNKPVFDFITGGEMQITTSNFDDILKYLADTRTFIENYHAHIQTKTAAAADSKQGG